MRTIIVKNNDSSSHVWGGKEFSPNEEYTILSTDLEFFQECQFLFSDLGSGLADISDGNSYFSDATDAWDYLLGNHIEAEVIEQTPFAKPDYRTKISKTPSIITVSPNNSEVIDYLLTEERYISGGKIINLNSEIGDYITAEVYDKDSIIPEAYRSSLCEDWPCVAKYIEGMWINPDSINEINTYPLNAKISAGLYLRLTYFATSSGSDRKIGVTYYLTKKLV